MKSAWLWLLISVLLPVPVLSLRPAQGVSIRPVDNTRAVGNINLAFSSDGSLLHVVGLSVADLAEHQNVRAVTYDAATGAVAHIVNLQPGTRVLSVMSEGRKAIVDASALRVGEYDRLLLLDTETGQVQDIPPSWYRPTTDPDANLSGDGRLISTYSEPAPGDAPMTVTVYGWATRALVAKRTSEEISAGGVDGGGVTVDGAVEFVNGRVGRKIVDLNTGGLIAWFGWLSVRSPNGAYVVEFPDRDWNESAPKDVLLKEGTTGKTLGKLDVQIEDDETYSAGAPDGAFCGTTGRFVLAHRRGAAGAAVYAIPSGALLASFPAEAWRDPNSNDPDLVSVACSSTGTRVAILSGTRLTFHDLR